MINSVNKILAVLLYKTKLEDDKKKKKYTESHTGSNLVILEAKWLGLIFPSTSYEACQIAYHNQCCCNEKTFHLLRNFQLCLLTTTKRQKLSNMSWQGKGEAQTLGCQYHPISYPHNFFLSAFTVWRTQSCKFSAIWGTASLLVRHSITGFVGTCQEDEPPGSLDLTIAKFFLWGYVIRAVLGCNGQVSP